MTGQLQQKDFTFGTYEERTTQSERHDCAGDRRLHVFPEPLFSLQRELYLLNG